MTTIGHVFQINVSDGSVPKQGVHSSEITDAGLSEDRVGNPKKQSGSSSALCLYSLEKILALQKEGHPIFPGSCGENLTLTGIEWEDVKIGTRLKIGKDILIEITGYCKPCAKIIGSFKGGDITRVFQESNPGWSRVYARVLSPGKVNIGDEVIITG